MENYFYVDSNQKQAGPITPAQFAAVGITAETLVWRKGLDQWTPAGELEELVPYSSEDTAEKQTAKTATTTQTTSEAIPVQTTLEITSPTQQPVQPAQQPATSPFNTPSSNNTEIPNHLWLAVLSVVFMVQPLGIFAIHHAAKVNFNVLQGKTYEALHHSNLAMRWSLIALAVSLVWFIFLLFTFGSTLLGYFSNNYEFIL